MTIYVGNLSYQAGEQELTQLFSEYGEVTSVKIVKDMATGRPRGFAFVEMSDEDSADRAIEDLHETEFLQRTLIVNKARPKSNDRPSGGGGGGFNRGGGGGGYNKRY
jgi:RNA recognition motif-containing protein